MYKAEWSTITLDGSIPQGEIERMNDNFFSYGGQQSSKERLAINLVAFIIPI